MSWGTACQTKLNKIKIGQNKCIRSIFFANKRESSTPNYALLQILKLQNVFKFKIVHLKGETPPALYDLVLSTSEVHNYNTIYATNQNLYRPASRTCYGLAIFKVTASKIWEKVPAEIKCL